MQFEGDDLDDLEKVIQAGNPSSSKPVSKPTRSHPGVDDFGLDSDEDDPFRSLFNVNDLDEGIAPEPKKSTISGAAVTGSEAPPSAGADGPEVHSAVQELPKHSDTSSGSGVSPDSRADAVRSGPAKPPRTPADQPALLHAERGGVALMGPTPQLPLLQGAECLESQVLSGATSTGAPAAKGGAAVSDISLPPEAQLEQERPTPANAAQPPTAAKVNSPPQVEPRLQAPAAGEASGKRVALTVGCTTTTARGEVLAAANGQPATQHAPETPINWPDMPASRGGGDASLPELPVAALAAAQPPRQAAIQPQRRPELDTPPAPMLGHARTPFAPSALLSTETRGATAPDGIRSLGRPPTPRHNSPLPVGLAAASPLPRAAGSAHSKPVSSVPPSAGCSYPPVAAGPCTGPPAATPRLGPARVSALRATRAGGAEPLTCPPSPFFNRRSPAPGTLPNAAELPAAASKGSRLPAAEPSAMRPSVATAPPPSATHRVQGATIAATTPPAPADSSGGAAISNAAHTSLPRIPSKRGMDAVDAAGTPVSKRRLVDGPVGRVTAAAAPGSPAAEEGAAADEQPALTNAGGSAYVAAPVVGAKGGLPQPSGDGAMSGGFLGHSAGPAATSHEVGGVDAAGGGQAVLRTVRQDCPDFTKRLEAMLLKVQHMHLQALEVRVQAAISANRLTRLRNPLTQSSVDALWQAAAAATRGAPQAAHGADGIEMAGAG